jgi:acyl-CoA synthetase (AMP-forming)/AMP-acid ligase II
MRDLIPPHGDAKGSLNALVAYWAHQQPDADAFIFLGAENVEKERLTFAQVAQAARGLARTLHAHAGPGARVLLMFEPGLAFVAAFFACHRTGMVPVPVVPVRKGRVRDAAVAVARDCRPSLLLCELGQTRTARDALFGEAALRGLPIAEVDVVMALAAGAGLDDGSAPSTEEPLAFLQYTSGSTSAPKGVMVRQEHLFANLDMMRLAMRNPWGANYVGWAPLYHDMGLIANMLEPFYLGGRCVMMAPAQMAQSPWLWLRAVSDYQAHTSGGSNFAYDLCLRRAACILALSGLDLSCWKVAFNSAEPVRADTIARFCDTFAAVGFERQTMFPCYGLAEATLLVSGGGARQRPVVRQVSKSQLEQGSVASPSSADDEQELVGCGEPMPDEVIMIVDASTQCMLPPGRIGEIWVRGPHIPVGYWQNPAASDETFHAVLEGDGARLPHLRTGDLGFIGDDGELYVTGRLKDLLIVRGRNIYPQDVEHTAQAAYPGLSMAAAFPLNADQVGLAVEVERGRRHDFDTLAAATAVRQAVMHEFELSLHAVHFMAPGTLPLTSSGKVRRKETQRRFIANILEQVGAAPYDQAKPVETP